MSAATLERPDVLARPTTDVVFLSRRDDLRLVLRPSQVLRDAGGNKIGETPTECLRFQEGVLRLPRSGFVKGEKGEQIDAKFALGRLLGDPEQGTAPHVLLGDRFDGFWRHEEPAPAPTPEEREVLAALGMELDVDGLAAFVAAEADGWARKDFIAEAQALLERARAKRDERDAEIAEAAQKARAEGEAAAKASATPKPKESKPAESAPKPEAPKS